MSARTESERTEDAERTASGFRLWMLIPAIGAGMVLAVFMLGLQRDDVQTLPSALIDKPVPEFQLAAPARRRARPLDRRADRAGVKLVNVWASWCAPCRAEHPQLMALSESGVTLYGINYKDEPANATAFLDEMGNPFARIGADTTGRTGIDFGVYGVPETFVVDGDGTIVYRHVGPITRGDIDKYIRPAIDGAKAG